MSIKYSVTAGVRWSSVSQFGRQAMQLVTTAILARLLSPADFGLIGMATIVIGFVTLFKDLGTSAAVIQRKEISQGFLSSIFWVNATFGLLATIILYFLSPYIARFYHEPMVIPLLQVLSVSFLISGLSILQQAILEREMAFNKLAKLEIFSTLCGSIVGIVSAILGFGVWSLVYQTLTVAAVTTILLWLANRWRPDAVFQWQNVKSVTNYSANLTGFNIFNYIVRNADYLLIGKFLGAQELGYYTLAYRIMLYPLQSITSVISRVMFPAFSQIHDDDARFRRIYLKIVESIAFITFPLMLGLFALAGPFVAVIFGQRWQPVVLLLIILAPVGMLQSVGATVGLIYQAKGRTDWMFRWGVITGIMAVTAFAVGLQWRIVGVATAYAFFSAIIIYPNFAIPFRLISLPVYDLIIKLWRTLICGAVMLVVIYSLRVLIADFLTNVAMLGLLIPLGIVVYALLSWFFNKQQMLGIINTSKA